MTEDELQLIEELGSYAYNPLGFALWAFPWGEEDTELRSSELQPWQRALLIEVGLGLRTVNEAIQIAVSSGHGIGKSALVSILIWWAFSTRPQTRGVVTANTENQLRTKTWVEITKWHRLFIAKDLFKCTASAIFSTDTDLAREWRFDIVPWSERNTEAFAGLHNKGGRILIVYDEASAIPDVIWETTEGALTDEDTEIIWLACGNPTRNQGRFRECFDEGEFAHRWRHFKVDSREVSLTNKEQIERWIDDYGEDSDFVRVRVKGEFPRTDASSFISRELAKEAIGRPVTIPQSGKPIILGVDVARFGTDFSVLFPRQGADAASRPVRIFQGLRTTQLVFEVAKYADELQARLICVDTGGVGGGVADQLIEQGYNVYEVGFGNRADGLDPGAQYGNKRAEIWGLLRNALPKLSLPAHIPGAQKPLLEELSSPTYTFNARQQIMLEPKEAMLRRGLPSPDIADALACTYAVPVNDRLARDPIHHHDYNPFSEDRLYA